MNKTNTKKLAITSILCAVAVVFFPGFREQVHARAAHGQHSVRGIARPKLWPVRLPGSRASHGAKYGRDRFLRLHRSILYFHCRRRDYFCGFDLQFERIRRFDQYVKIHCQIKKKLQNVLLYLLLYQSLFRDL